MTRPQPGIFAEGTRAHHHLELRLVPSAPDEAVTAAIAATRAAGAVRRANGGVAVVVGVGPQLATRLLGTGAPPLFDFGGYRSPDGRHEAPGTQRDVWVWIHGPARDDLVDVTRRVVTAWKGTATLESDVVGFVYRDSRDLTGFVDGTANPTLEDAPGEVLVATGGTCAMTVHFTHDLDAFDALDEPDQERVVGRTKRDDRELEGDAKPDDAHIARVEIDDDAGRELAVYRRSVPWADGAHQGLQFVAFGADLERFDRQLRRMYGNDDGLVDRLLAFTAADAGSFWFCPSVDQLEALDA